MRRVLGSITVASLFAGSALAQPDYEFQWATIGSPGNAPYQSTDPDNPNNADGRGSVPHVYRMSKLEVTTAQWLEFTNTFSTQTDQFAFTKFGPLYWGAEADPTWGGSGTRYRLCPDGGASQPGVQIECEGVAVDGGPGPSPWTVRVL